MGNDLRIEAREAVVTHLKAGITTANIYGEGVLAQVVWPFVKPGQWVVSPLRASCLDGCTINARMNCFARGESSDDASALGQLVVGLLDGAELTAPSGHAIRPFWRGSPVTLKDTDGWQVVHDFEIRVHADAP